MRKEYVRCVPLDCSAWQSLKLPSTFGWQKFVEPVRAVTNEHFLLGCAWLYVRVHYALWSVAWTAMSVQPFAVSSPEHLRHRNADFVHWQDVIVVFRCTLHSAPTAATHAGTNWHRQVRISPVFILTTSVVIYCSCSYVHAYGGYVTSSSFAASSCELQQFFAR